MLNKDDLKYIASVMETAEETESVQYKKVKIMIAHYEAESEYRDKVSDLRKQFDELESK